MLCAILCTGSKNVPSYRCYFYGRDNHIIGREEYNAATDEQAIVDARAWYAERKSKDGFEVWERDRFVYGEDRPNHPIVAGSAR